MFNVKQTINNVQVVVLFARVGVISNTLNDKKFFVGVISNKGKEVSLIKTLLKQLRQRRDIIQVRRFLRKEV